MTAPSQTPEAAGLEVVAWRWETPIPHVGDGTKWGWSFASHWSTPPSSLNAEPLVTAALAQARIAELEEALRPFAVMADAGDQRPKDESVWAGQDGLRITYGDFRIARAALQQETQP